jgi:hypothetical protein
MSEDYSLIPDRIMQNLIYYVKGEEAPGGFLYTVLCNDLFGAIGRADSQMTPLIPLLVKYIHCKTPVGCHGSPELVKEWMSKPRKESQS